MFGKNFVVVALVLSIVIFLGVNAKKTKEVVKEVKKEEEVKLVDCETTKGSLRIEVHPDWSPLGAERFLDLVEDGFFTDIAFFRSIKGFLTQFGISDKPEMQHWHVDNIEDDPNLHMKMEKNYVSFAGSGKNSRNTQIFIAYQYSNFLGHEPWETPFGVVVRGQKTLNDIYRGYEDMPPHGNGPDQKRIRVEGNDYLRREFPLVDYINSCKVVKLKKPKMVETLAAKMEKQEKKEKEREKKKQEEKEKKKQQEEKASEVETPVVVEKVEEETETKEQGVVENKGSDEL